MLSYQTFSSQGQRFSNQNSQLHKEPQKDVNQFHPLNFKTSHVQMATSRFGKDHSVINDSNENVIEYSDEQLVQINETGPTPLTLREQLNARQKGKEETKCLPERKKTDSRYQRLSYLEHDFSVDLDQSHNMFDEFDQEEKDQQIIRLQIASNTGMSMSKNSLADLSRKLDITSIMMNQDASSENNHFLYSNPNNNNSPKFSESFLPQFNKEVLNELAANYQMMELTPETDLKMMLLNKSIFNNQREESVYSNQYADPVEMGLSPRNLEFAYTQSHQHQHTMLSFNPNPPQSSNLQVPQGNYQLGMVYQSSKEELESNDDTELDEDDMGDDDMGDEGEELVIGRQGMHMVF
mmetsp:Transcript_9340/g.8786  ORF Transcript_9340/g.8786 Transcript_9340/m.8786 type:complete len:351 (+) Transcript_9340:694-1746(+)